jgi:hypothetical protein
MKNLWLMSAALVALSGSMFADSIWTGAGSTVGFLNNIPTTASFVAGTPAYPDTSTTNSGTPFWNNSSPDNINGSNHVTNVGDVLSGYVTGTNLIGGNASGTVVTAPLQTTENISGQYYAFTSNDTTVAGGDPVTPNTTGTATSMTPSLEFSFVSSATAYNIAMLYAAPSTQNSGAGNLGAPATVFGTYTIGAGNVFDPIVIDGGIAANTTGTPTTLETADTLYANNFVYGFYATVCYAYTGTTCTQSVTYTTGFGNFSTGMSSGNLELGALGWNHFALFELANGEEVLGFTDSPWSPGTQFGTQGIGDFDDAVIALTNSAVPEPGTIAIMGLGLAGLGLLGRRRFAKK